MIRDGQDRAGDEPSHLRRAFPRRKLLLAPLMAVLALACAAASWGGTYDPAADMNSMYNTTLYSGAQAWWKAGYTGKGVDVAVIDTGVNAVEGLAGPGKIIDGPDLSLESQNLSFRYRDTNGHGTFMAGLIAGHDMNLTEPYGHAPAAAYRGIAPDARIVNVKVGVADGGVDVSQVIAAIDWVVQHKNDNDLNIRIISLSYGTNTRQPYEVDPLSYAVEQAWKAGIVVVAAAGNTGYQLGAKAPGLANPAYNPYVIAVGGTDSMGTAELRDDTVGEFSANAAVNCSTGCRTPDFVAPGSHIQGLRVPNSWLDLNHPEGRLGDRFFRGSGTSQAAAIVSGAAALILQKYPRSSPNQVKGLLAATTSKLQSTNDKWQGSGEMNLDAALTTKPSAFGQSYTNSTGTGSLELARGLDHLTDDGVVLQGEQDIFGHTFDSAAMATLESKANSWSGNSWSGNSWSGSSWSGNSWSGNSWSGSSWSGGSWAGGPWQGASWG